MSRRDPLLPRGVLVFISVVVTLGWLAVVVSAVLNPANSGPLLVVSGLLASVIGASFGIQVRRASKDEDVRSGDDAP